MAGSFAGGGRFAAAALGFATLALLCGCGGPKGQGVPLAPVSGKVMWKGQPVEGAFVSFVPETQGIHTGQAVTQKDGTFTIPNGVAIGWCKVGVVKTAPPEPRGPAPPGVDEVTWSEMGNNIGKSLLPPTPPTLRFEVQDKKNVFDIVLEGEAPS